jgi:hypothetical protein
MLLQGVETKLQATFFLKEPAHCLLKKLLIGAKVIANLSQELAAPFADVETVTIKSTR